VVEKNVFREREIFLEKVVGLASKKLEH